MPPTPLSGSPRAVRRSLPLIAALALGVAASVTAARPAGAAYAPRVVIVVGPVGSATPDFLSHAKAYARQARAYGATVIEVYTPHATWARVVEVAQGANIFIYLGHGNGWPSPYGPWQNRTKDGVGLNPYDGSGNSQHVYYGEAYLQRSIRLAPGAVVLLNRLCYASGSAEPGMSEPTWSTAVRRVDNYGAGFLRTGASVVLADGHTDLAYELASLFGSNQKIYGMWSRDPKANGHIRSFDSSRNARVRVHLDPDTARTAFYRSLATRPGVTTRTIRIPAYSGVTRGSTKLRSAPGNSTILASISGGQRLFMRARLRIDGSGRTWTPVMTRAGRAGWVAGWNLDYAGSARTTKALVLRSNHSLFASRRALVSGDVRVRIVGTAVDTHGRSWLKVVTPAGRTGWIAAWLTVP